MPLAVAWEPDLWGRIRRNVESSDASAQASAADVESTQPQPAGRARGRLLPAARPRRRARAARRSVEAYEHSLKLTQNRYAGGVASRADVAQAETQLETTRAQAIDLGVQRAQLEHAIAVLVGEPASSFSHRRRGRSTPTPPPIPVGVPSELLERRPDVAAAERPAAAGERADRRRRRRRTIRPSR